MVGAVGTGCVIRNGFLVIGASQAAELALGSPTTAGKHGIKLDVTINPNHITYQSDDGAADPSNLPVMHNDVVTWKAKTHGPKHHLALIFAPLTPFVDVDTGFPVFAFFGSEVNESHGGGIGSNASIGPHVLETGYEYLVAVWDDESKKTYSNDPKIIVGTGYNAAEAELESAKEKIKRAEELGDSSLKEKLIPIQKNLQDIINGLNK